MDRGHQPRTMRIDAVSHAGPAYGCIAEGGGPVSQVGNLRRTRTDTESGSELGWLRLRLECFQPSVLEVQSILICGSNRRNRVTKRATEDAPLTGKGIPVSGGLRRRPRVRSARISAKLGGGGPLER